MEDKSIIERTRAALKAGIIIRDGHTIYAPERYLPHYTVRELKPLCRTYQSDIQSIKGTIFDANGNVLPTVQGIWNLDFLFWLCGQVGGDKAAAYRYLGRGSQAQTLVDEITRAVA